VHALGRSQSPIRAKSPDKPPAKQEEKKEEPKKKEESSKTDQIKPKFDPQNPLAGFSSLSQNLPQKFHVLALMAKELKDIPNPLDPKPKTKIVNGKIINC